MRYLKPAVLLLLSVFPLFSQEYIQVNGQGAYAFLQPEYQDGNIVAGVLAEDARFEIPLFTPQGQSFVTVHFQRGSRVIFQYILPPLLGGRMMIGYPVRGTLKRDFIMTLEGLRARAVFRAGSDIEFQYRMWERGALKYEFAVIREGTLRGPVTIQQGDQDRLLVQGIPFKFVVVQDTPLPVLALEQ